MSGQYPPPNPSHPFSRAAHHQRAPTLPPWGHHAPQPSGMRNPMNFYGSPHMGLPSRANQSWNHPKPLDNRPAAVDPAFGLQMTRGPSEQQESMDLSSHAATVPLDTMRNGTDINGDVARVAEDSVVTSVIAPNPLRDNSVPISEVNCSSLVTQNTESPSRPGNLIPDPSSCTSGVVQSNSSVTTSSASQNVSGFESLDLKTVAAVSSEGQNLLVDKTFDETKLKNKYEEPIFHSSFSDTFETTNKTNKESTLDSLSKSVENFANNSCTSNLSGLNASQSFLDSTLSADNDDSKLVVAESSTDDIFGTSPHPSTSNILKTEITESCKITSKPPENVPDKTPEEFFSAIQTNVQSLNTSSATVPAPTAPPQPSIENVESLLENMFNSQEETSCSSQTSNSNSVPQPVIVPNTAKTLTEALKPIVQSAVPLKEDELAKTLAEEDPLEALVKEEKKEALVTEEKKEEPPKNNIMDEIEKKLELLTESGVLEETKLDIQEVQPSVAVPLARDSSSSDKTLASEVKSEDSSLSNNVSIATFNDPVLSASQIDSIKPAPKFEALTSKPEISTSQVPSKDTSILPKCEAGPSGSNSEAGTSSNPFIEVETELEKMFAGIVEPTDEVGSDNPSQASTLEPKKSLTNKKPVVRRKKTNSRRASDNSLFGGSSGETTPVKKRGKKRLNESGSERSSKKMKRDGLENLKKGKVPKDLNSDKVKGPFVHIEGSKESPGSVVVVNSGARADDEDGTDKALARRKHGVAQRNEWVTRKAGPVYSSSAMSARYNSDKADLSWVCVFCKRGPHCVGGLAGEPAGDLFGPYRVPATPPHDDSLPPGHVSDLELREEQKRRGGGKLPKSLRTSGGADQFLQKAAKKNKRSQSTDSVESQCGLLAVDGGYEVWMHGQCAEWAPGLTLIGSQLVGLEDAVWTALRTRCTHCGERGAGISCVVRSCPTRMHFPCAVVSGWLLDTDTFIARCQSHRTRLRPA